MFSFQKASKLLVVGVAASLSAFIISSSPVFAASLVNINLPNNTALTPLEITPICSNGADKQSFWKVINSNSRNVQVNWTNIDNNNSGTFNAVPGTTTSQLQTYYNASDNNNTTSFASEGNTTTTNAPASACPSVSIPPVPQCVDGNIQQNLVVNIDKGEASIHTLNNQLLCSDVTIDFSSYTMPDNYDGNGFFIYPTNAPNPTATPQYIFGNETVILKHGTVGTANLNINLPNRCKNVQVDVYYAPEITQVGAQGHGTQNILSKIYLMSNNCETPPTPTPVMTPPTPTPTPVMTPPTPTPVMTPPTLPIPPAITGGRGGGDVFPPEQVLSSNVSALKVISPIAAPTRAASPSNELAYTGQSPILAYLLALSLITATLGVTRAVRKEVTTSSSK